MGSSELTKGVECLGCKHILTCKGHIEGGDCINFDEREEHKDGRCQMDKNIDLDI